MATTNTPLTLTQMRTEIKKFYNRGDFTDAEIATYMDFALETAIEQREWSELKVLTTFTTTANQENVGSSTLNTETRSIYSVTLNQTSPVRRDLLLYVTPQEFLQQYNTSTDYTGEPRRWTILNRDIYLGPTPDAVYTLGVLRSTEPANFTTSATASPIGKLERYLIHYATGWMYDVKEMDDLSQKHFQRAASHLQDAMRKDSMLETQLRTPTTPGYDMVNSFIPQSEYRIG